jgi:SAM-dependent methyltransferase
LPDDVSARELAHHEALYSGEAQELFAKPAVRTLRRHMVRRILAVTGATRTSRVLSLGCGIGDTELLLAPHVAHLTGVDLSSAAIRQARADAERMGATNTDFIEATAGAISPKCGFDVVIGIFFLHHLPDNELRAIAVSIRNWLSRGGVFYSLDPSRYRLSGALGRLLVPRLMRHYQTPDERQLSPRQTADWFREAGFDARFEMYDFVSTPLAGLLPSWDFGYRVARLADEALIRTPGLRALSSNFEVIAHSNH